MGISRDLGYCLEINIPSSMVKKWCVSAKEITLLVLVCFFLIYSRLLVSLISAL
jgi:hypothetical protein